MTIAPRGRAGGRWRGVEEDTRHQADLFTVDGEKSNSEISESEG